MRHILLFAALVLMAVPSKARAAEFTGEPQFQFGFSISFGTPGYFYSPLRGYGDWIEFDRGFYGWRPLRVRRGWRPYLYGRWAWTDYGWYWISDEPFGWAVYHYGRWHYDDYYGWIWIPDHTWGPAWVEWRYDHDYIGWAPLPPYARFSFSVGIRFTTRWHAPSHYWTFVPHRHMTTHTMYRHVANESHSRRLIRTTRSAGTYEIDRDRVINRGVDRSYIERQGNTRIERIDVRESRERGERIIRDGRGERIEVYRPDPNQNPTRPERIEARRPERRISIDFDHLELPEGRERMEGGSNRRGGATRQDEERRRMELPTPPEEPRERSRELRSVPSAPERPEQRPQETWRVRPEVQREPSAPRAAPDHPSRERAAPEPPRREAPAARPEPRRESSPSNERSRSKDSKRGGGGG